MTPYSPPAGDASPDESDPADKPMPKPKRSRRDKSAPSYSPDAFETFWSAYPRKDSRQAAVRAWDKLKPDKELCRVMYAALKCQCKSEQWAEANKYSRFLLDEIRKEHTAAYGSRDPDKIRAFLTRRMDVWQTGSVNRYLDEHCMALARAAQIPRDEFAALTDGLHCHCGFDLGKRIDLSGVGAVFPLPDGRVAVKGHGFMPEGGAQRHEHTDRVPYTAWARDGYCTLTPGDVTDNSYVDNWICTGGRDHGWKVDEVDYDGHNATDLAIKMCQERNNEDFCVEVAQTCAGQNLAVKGFRELLLQGKIVIEESPLLMWCLANAIEIQNNYGDIKLSKKHKDDTERIDPVAAIMNALARVLVKRSAEPDLDEILSREDFSM